MCVHLGLALSLAYGLSQAAMHLNAPTSPSPREQVVAGLLQD